MQSGATRMRQRDDTLPPDRPRSEHEPRPTAPGTHFAHDFTRVPVQNNIQAKLKSQHARRLLGQEADRVAHELSEKSSGAEGVRGRRGVCIGVDTHAAEVVAEVRLMKERELESSACPRPLRMGSTSAGSAVGAPLLRCTRLDEHDEHCQRTREDDMTNE